MKGIFEKLINWVLYTSLFAACAAVGMCIATERLLLGVAPTGLTPLHVLILGGVLIVYNTHFLLQKSTPELSDRFGWSQHYRLWHYISIIIGAGCLVISLFKMPAIILQTCIVLALLSFAYSVPMLPLKEKKRLKYYGWIKIILLATVWTIVTAVLPMLYHNMRLADYPFEIAIRFTLLLPLCLAFDIRDMQTDINEGIYTVPNRIGVKNTYHVIDSIVLLFIVFSAIQYYRYPSATRIVAEIITAIAVKCVVVYTKTHHTDRAYLGLVDGIMLLYAILIVFT
jgi:hypothetical protein